MMFRWISDRAAAAFGSPLRSGASIASRRAEPPEGHHNPAPNLARAGNCSFTPPVTQVGDG